MNRPSFANTIRALTLADCKLRIVTLDDEADVAEVLRHVEATHQGGHAQDAGSGSWGTCAACTEPWPCAVWNEAEQLGLLFLGRAQDRVAAHSRQTLDRLAERDRNARRPS